MITSLSFTFKSKTQSWGHLGSSPGRAWAPCVTSEFPVYLCFSLSNKAENIFFLKHEAATDKLFVQMCVKFSENTDYNLLEPEFMYSNCF